MTRWAKFRALPRSERRTLLAAMAWLPLSGLVLRAFGLRRLQAWLRRCAAPSDGRLSRDEINRVAALVELAAARNPFPSTCLTRSLLLLWMLRRRGVASELRIGVRLSAGILNAHAWIEWRGMPINDRSNVGEQFAAFARFPPPAALQSP